MKQFTLFLLAFMALAGVVCAQQHFVPVAATGLPYSICVDNALIDGIPLVDGDEIGVFDEDLCVGAREFEYRFPLETLAITAWEADPDLTLPGFTSGNRIRFHIWDESTDTEYEAVVQVFTDGRGNGRFGYDGLTQAQITAIIPENGIDLVVEPRRMDFGRVYYFQTVTYPVFIRNIGEVTRTLISAETSDGPFTVTNVDHLPIEPGEEIELDVELAVNYGDEMEQGRLTLTSDDPVEPIVELDLSAEVREPWNHFDPVELTEQSYSIVVDDAAIGGYTMVNHDEIGIFDGDLCVGARIVGIEDFPITILTWEGDLDNPGFELGHTIRYLLWSHRVDIEVEADAEYLNGHGDGTFGAGEFAEVNLTAMIRMTRNVQGRRFEMISLTINPANPDVPWIFRTLRDLMIVYADNGGIYIPRLINTIGNFDVHEAYQVFCQQDNQWVVEGNWLDPNMEFNLFGNRWNWLGYPFWGEIPIIVALTEIADHVEIVQNDAGGIWIPRYHLNTIGMMETGEGYFVFLYQNVTFHYHEDGVKTVTDNEVWEIPEVADAPTPTGMPYAVLVHFTDGLLARNPATVEIYDGNLKVGKAIVLEDHDLTPVIAWQGSPEYDLPGFTPGHSILVKVLEQDGSTLVSLNSATKFGEDGYAEITLDTSSLIIPTEFTVSSAYPNPFNPTITVPFGIPGYGNVTISVFNLLGQQVYKTERTYEAGSHHFEFDASKSGSELVSGIYFLQIRYKDQTMTQKVMLLK